MIVTENLTALSAKRSAKTETADFGFSDELANAYKSIYFNKKSFVAVSPKFEEKLTQDPKLAENIAEKIEKLSALGGKDSVIVVDRRGEVSQYRTKPDPRQERAERLEAEERKEALKARLRKKARVDAYVKIVKQNALKRKLIEQENAKRPRKRYGISVSKLDSMARSILQLPTRTPDFEI